MTFTPGSAAAAVVFAGQMVQAQGKIIAEMVKAIGDDLPHATRQAIWEHLEPLSEAASDPSIPTFYTELFDRLVAMLPPPSQR